MKNALNAVVLILVSICAWVAISDKERPWSNGFNYNFSDSVCECDTQDITEMYSDYISEWKSGISTSFDKAEKEVFGSKPTPDIVGPNPDPDKCICGGSGVITQGDGHKTPCPYHAKKINKPLLILEE